MGLAAAPMRSAQAPCKVCMGGHHGADRAGDRCPARTICPAGRCTGICRSTGGKRPGTVDSVRDLAAAAGVNPNTMQRALAQLEAEGLVRTERTSGRFVTEDTDLIEQLRASAARNIAADFLEKMRSIGYTPQQAAELLRSWNETEGKQHE